MLVGKHMVREAALSVQPITGEFVNGALCTRQISIVLFIQYKEKKIRRRTKISLIVCVRNI